MLTLIAKISNPVLKGDLGSGDPAGVLGRYLGSFWGVLYLTGGIAFLFYLVWGGVEWTIAGANKDRVENAKNKIQNALFGLAILAASWALVRAVGWMLGIDILETLQFDVSRLAP